MCSEGFTVLVSVEGLEVLLDPGKSRHRRFDRCVRVMSAVVVGVGELAVMLDPAIYRW